MSLKSSNKVETNRYELVVEVDGATFEAAVNKVYKKEVKKITVPGFRKGKAPKSIIEKMYGEQVFYEDAMQSLYPEALEAAAKEANVVIVNDKIDLSVESVDKNGFVFKAVVTVEPEVAIEGYKGISINPKSLEVTDEDIDKEIKKVQERNGRMVTVEDRAAENGDTAVIDFEGFVDGVTFDGGSAENYNLVLGSGSFIPGFEDQIVGHNAGEEFSVFVKFPEDYQAEELKGKDSEFKIKLHEIKKKELPEIDDEFAKDVSECDTLEAYKETLKEKIAETKKNEYEADIDKQLTDKLAEILQAEIPQAMFENQITSAIRDMEISLRSQGLDIQTYLQYTGMDEATLRSMHRERAEKQVKVRLALQKIAELENILVSDEEIEDEYNAIASAYNMDTAKVKEVLDASELTKDIRIKKAMSLVKDNSVVAQAE